MAAIRRDACTAADEPGARAARGSAARTPRGAWLIAVAYVVLELAVSGRYGFQQDELYFLVARDHPAFGYVDQPPLAVLLTRTTDVLGVDPTAIRILPALAGGGVVILTARLAALLDGGRLAQLLAALAVAIAPIFLGAMHVGNTTPYDLLGWTVVTLCVTTAVLRNRPRWWLGAGLVTGIGVNDEYLVLALVAALILGILLTSAHRDVLATRWPWLGGLVALLLWFPNLVWQFANGWPQLTMASALHRENNSAADYLAGLPGQLVYAGLLGVPLVIAGFGVLWRTARLRFLGVTATVVVVYVLAWVPGKVYYADGILPVLLAAGAGWAERWIGSARRRRIRPAVLGALAVVGTVAILPAVLPVLPVTQLHTVNGATSIADGVGWPHLADEVVAQDEALTRAGRPPSSIFTGSYAEASAILRYDRKRGLPPAISGHNAFWSWGPGTAADNEVLYVDAGTQLRPFFARCHRLAVVNPPYQVRNDWNDLPIGVCSGPSASWQALWPKLKHYD